MQKKSDEYQPQFFFFFFQKIFIFYCLAASGLSCSKWASVQLWRADLVAPRHVGSQFPNQGLNPCPLHWKADSQSQDPGMSQPQLLKPSLYLNSQCQAEILQQSWVTRRQEISPACISVAQYLESVGFASNTPVSSAFPDSLATLLDQESEILFFSILKIRAVNRTKKRVLRFFSP